MTEPSLSGFDENTLRTPKEMLKARQALREASYWSELSRIEGLVDWAILHNENPTKLPFVCPTREILEEITERFAAAGWKVTFKQGWWSFDWTARWEPIEELAGRLSIAEAQQGELSLVEEVSRDRPPARASRDLSPYAATMINALLTAAGALVAHSLLGVSPGLMFIAAGPPLLVELAYRLGAFK